MAFCAGILGAAHLLTVFNTSDVCDTCLFGSVNLMCVALFCGAHLHCTASLPAGQASICSATASLNLYNTCAVA